jgi:hypothetical protein
LAPIHTNQSEPKQTAWSDPGGLMTLPLDFIPQWLKINSTSVKVSFIGWWGMDVLSAGSIDLFGRERSMTPSSRPFFL